MRAGVPALLSGPHHWFEPLADHLGAAYLRYSFTRDTAQEVDALWDLLDLAPGDRVLDVGCGPGRHVHALAARGAVAVGIDIAERFVRLAATDAPPGAHAVRADARALPVRPAFDAAIALCQGAFGLGRSAPLADPSLPPPGPDPDEQVLAAMAGALRPGGRLALSAFSAYFQVRWLEDGDTYEAATGLNHERTRLRAEDGTERDADLWTTCYTPRELRLMATAAGLVPRAVWSVTPGRYRAGPPDLDQPEYLLVAERPA